MPVPPEPRGRKKRLLRIEDVSDDLLLVIRAMPGDRVAGVEEMADQAMLSASRYVVERGNGQRDLLYGVSVFAHREGQNLRDVLYRFPAAPRFVEATVGVIRSTGFEVFPTGSNADHFDVQLIRGVTEADLPPSETDVRAAANRLLDAAGEMRPNPSYAVDGLIRPEEE